MLRQAALDSLLAVLGPRAEDVGDLTRFLSEPPNPEMGDVAFGCFALAKQRKASPAAIAAELAEQIRPTGLIRRVQPAGPYLNFFAEPQALLAALFARVVGGEWAQEAHIAQPKKIMIEFSQPNTHKTFHVGHLRNIAIGDSLVRIHQAVGHDVMAANYYGDFGIDVAKCLWWLANQEQSKPPATARSAWLGEAYRQANAALVSDGTSESDRLVDQRRDAVRQVLHGLETQREDVWERYLTTRKWCLDDFAEVYRWLDVSFDVDFFESQMEAPAAALVDDALERGVFAVSDGAVVCDLSPELKVPALLRKSDGTSLYMTWDLALAIEKMSRFGIEQSIYVVGSEQRFHFQQLFETLRRMGYERANDCRHVAYELVVLPEGKMSSRKGTAIPLNDLRDAVTRVIDERTPQADGQSPEQRQDTVRKIAIACLKYGMLKVGTNKQVVFALDEWTQPEGDTGAYILYNLARIRSIFRLAGASVDVTDLSTPTDFGATEERALLTHTLRFPEILQKAARNADPSLVAGWVYDGARLFSRFYRACPVLKAEQPLRTQRLALLQLTDKALTSGLAVLGITPVDEM